MALRVLMPTNILVNRVQNCQSHSAVQCDDSEVVNGLFHAMYAPKVSLVTLIYKIISEFKVENDLSRAKCVRKGSLATLS
jgi:hypothetical protein